MNKQPEQHQHAFDYERACKRATEDQGLSPFAAAEGWRVDQTGGFTMVAYKDLDDGSTWSVTRNAIAPEAPYLCVRAPLDWDGCDPPYEQRELPLAEALQLGSTFDSLPEKQRAAIEATQRAYQPSIGLSLKKRKLYPARAFCEGFYADDCYPEDAVIVEWLYCDERDSAEQQERTGLEVTVFGADGEVLDSQDFG